MLAGLSTLGVRLSYGVGSSYTTASYDILHRINSIGGISSEPETIDASALEDYVERTVAGRATTGGSFTVSVNLTSETLSEWSEVISAYQGMTSGQKMFVQVHIPTMKSFFVSVQPPQALPLADIGQNELQVVDVPLTIEEAIGYQTEIAASDSETP